MRTQTPRIRSYGSKKVKTMTASLFRTFLAAALGAVLLASCVSKRKYNDLLFSHEKLQAGYHDLKTQSEQFRFSSADALEKKQEELEEKERLLKERESRIQELDNIMKSQRDAIRNLKQEVCSALKCFTPDELSVTVRGGKLYVSMSDKLLFDSGSDQVNERGKEAIKMLAMVLANSDLEIMVEGHTDNVPISNIKYKDNWDLSVHRATTVIRILADNGIPSSRIIASGRGEHYPLSVNTSPDGRQQNRRTEIVLSPRLDKLWELTENEEMEFGKK
jgi:chemotaxis protein MotB